MPTSRFVRPRSLAFAFAILLAGIAAPAAAAEESCAYDPATKAVTAVIAADGEATLAVVSGALWFGSVPAPCGAATTANTDSIQVSGAPVTAERLTVDQSGGFLGPGASAESNTPEIELSVALGDADDDVVVIGTEGDDRMAMGQNGLSLNSDGDVDVTFAPLPAHVEIQGRVGANILTGRGGWGAGLAFAGAVTLLGGDLADELNGGNGDDEIVGGDGNDVVNGNAGDDQVAGDAGNDKLSGGEGTDYIVGGAGADTFTGGFGNDFMVAFDGEADTSLNGGPDTDLAFVDPGVDPTPSAVEGLIDGPPQESCSYDPGTRTVTARPEPSGEATLKVAASGELLFGFAPHACGGATTTNTDSISVTGYPGLNETLVVDQSEGVLGPGFTSEFNIPEIELATNLGDATDTIVVLGTPGDDVIAPGQNGIALNSDGDVDVTVSPGAFPLEIHVLGGNDFVNGRGQGGAGLHFLGPLTITGGDGDDEIVGSTEADVLDGGPGNDTINAQAGDDLVRGGPGDDFLTASEGNDVVIGGPGADSMSGGFDDDLLDADDGEADVQIHGGPGTDTAYYDANLDPGTIAVENSVADPGEEPPPPPPPPPPGQCEYYGTAKALVATMPTGGTATLAVVGGQIRFGTAPVACGTATTANTDSITVNGPAGTTERLVLDQSQGAFAPGEAAEGNTPEIEMTLALGDAADEIVVLGTAGNDTIAAGANGLSLNNDGDVDVSLSPFPDVLELHGLGGVNFLSGRGGFGAGLAFPRRLVFHAGPNGDEMNGAGLDDVFFGGAGNDLVFAFGGNDQLFGGAGNDSLSGSDGNDTIVGGAGADDLLGGFDDDTLEADDDEADVQIHGGPGIDTAYVDDGLDPATIAVETRIPR